jgi:hypothetical protein
MKNSEKFIKSIRNINLQNEDYLVSFDVNQSLHQRRSDKKTLQAIRNRQSTDPSFPECSRLQFENLMELLDILLTTTYFQFKNKFYQQKECMAMGKTQSPLVSNIFMKHFEEMTLDTQTTNPLNGSDTSTTHSRFGHIDQRGYSNFFTISTALGLPSNSQWKLKLMILFHILTIWLLRGAQH